MKKLLIFTILLFGITSCSIDETKLEKTKVPKVLVLGNSITKSPAGGEWLGNWGMAASSPEKDFCAILKKDLKSQVFDIKTIGPWERDFNCNTEYISIPSIEHYDYIILKVGENAWDLDNFETELENLVNFYKNYGTNIVLITTIWDEYAFHENGDAYQTTPVKDNAIKSVALKTNSILVDISFMINKREYYAWNEYQDGAIGSHPNDLGMQFIADKILEKIK